MALAMFAGCAAGALAQTQPLRKPGVVVQTMAKEPWPRCDYRINSYECSRSGSTKGEQRYLIVVQDLRGQSEVIVESASPYTPGEKVLIVFEPYGLQWIAPIANLPD